MVERLAGDERGLVLELLPAEDFVSQRNAHIVVRLPGIVRGNHYHTKGRETISVLGPSLVRFRNQGKIEEVVVPDKEAWRFVFLPGVSHAIKNLSREAISLLLLIRWSTTPLIRTRIETCLYRRKY